MIEIYMSPDLNNVVGFDWDEGNARKSVEKHDVSQAEAESVFFNEPLIVIQASRHSTSEERFNALGTTVAARLLHVTFTLRGQGTLIRFISARDMSRNEKKIYEQA